MTRPLPLAGRSSMTIALQSRLAYLAAIAMTIVMGAAALTGCTPEEVTKHAASIGVSVTPEQAQAIATGHNTKPHVILAVAQTNPSAITPEQAKAIAWTALVVEQQKAAAAAMPAGTTAKMWAALRDCEASGNYAARSSSGKYQGAYQMDRSFWVTYGGDPSISPAQASPAAQDAVAYAGFRARGRSPWTADKVKCGLRAGLPVE